MGSRPRLLDLFCGAGGAAVGYHRAGFEVVGVDHKEQRQFPGWGMFPADGFRFIQADAMTYPLEGFDVIHASPPCQRYSHATNCQPGLAEQHPDLLGAIRERLLATGSHYVIENVVGAPMESPIMLCGTYFGLKVYRHRLFEVRPEIAIPFRHEPHRDNTPKAGSGQVSDKGFMSVAGNCAPIGYARKAMGIDWMNRDGLSQAIPPAYTEWIGKQLMKVLA